MRALDRGRCDSSDRGHDAGVGQRDTLGRSCSLGTPWAKLCRAHRGRQTTPHALLGDLCRDWHSEVWNWDSSSTGLFAPLRRFRLPERVDRLGSLRAAITYLKREIGSPTLWVQEEDVGWQGPPISLTPGTWPSEIR